MTIGRIGAVLGLISLLLTCWMGAHYTRPMAPSPWPPPPRVPSDADEAIELAGNFEMTEHLDAFHEAAPEDRALVFRQGRINIERALRSSHTIRVDVEMRRRFVMSDALLETLALWKHRAAAILVEDDPARAVRLSLSLWRHSVDAAQSCDSVVACSLSAIMVEIAMTAAESVVLHFGTASQPAVVWRVQNLRRQIATSFLEAPTMVLAIENDYRFVRAHLHENFCVPLDRAETESVLRRYYGRLRDYAAGHTLATAGLVASPAEGFSRLYNPCGRSVAEMAYMNLVPILDRHRAAFAEIATRQRALLQGADPR